jgi:hypothetical protein
MSTGPLGPVGPPGPQGRKGLQGRRGPQGSALGYPGWAFYSTGGVAKTMPVTVDSTGQYFSLDLQDVPYGTFLTTGPSATGGGQWTYLKFPTTTPPDGAFWVLRWLGYQNPYVFAPVSNGTIDQYPSGTTTTYPQGTSTDLRLDQDSTYIIMYNAASTNYIVF